MRRPSHATWRRSVLLHPSLTLLGVSIAIKKGRQQIHNFADTLALTDLLPCCICRREGLSSSSLPSCSTRPTAASASSSTRSGCVVPLHSSSLLSSLLPSCSPLHSSLLSALLFCFLRSPALVIVPLGGGLRPEPPRAGAGRDAGL